MSILIVLLVLSGISTLLFSVLSAKNIFSFGKGIWDFGNSASTKASDNVGKSFGRAFLWNVLAGLSWTAFIVLGIITLLVILL